MARGLQQTLYHLEATMAIIEMLDNELSEFPEGAYCSLTWSREQGDPQLEAWVRPERCPEPGCNGGCIASDEGVRPWARCIACRGTGATGNQVAGQSWRGVVVLRETHHGLCIAEREQNGPDDSDWLMLVWDPVAGSASWRHFATTRGWSYPCYASAPDATPEVLAAYAAWSLRERRRMKAHALRARRAADMAAAAAAGLRNRHEVARLRAACGPATDSVLALLRTRRFRSEFRRSLCEQVRAWLTNPAPQHSSPLSLRQLQAITAAGR